MLSEKMDFMSKTAILCVCVCVLRVRGALRGGIVLLYIRTLTTNGICWTCESMNWEKSGIV